MTDTSPDASLNAALLETSLVAAREAGAYQRAMEGRLGPEAWSEKATSDFVTDVDRESERIILGHIESRFPDHAILAEESGAEVRGERGSSPFLWIVDPLDGTTNWLHGYPEYAVSIACADAQGLRTAVVVNSATEETFAALRGRGATRNGAPIRVSSVSEARIALLGTGFPFKKAELLPGYLRALGTMLEHTSGVRRAGAAALDLCALACGRLDAFWEHWLMEWDIAAGALIVQEAGGTFAPLPDAGDPALADAVAGGERICRAFGGDGSIEPARGGGFLAGNGLLEDHLTDLWLGAMRTD